MGEKQNFTYKDLIIWAKKRVGHASGGANYMLGSFPYPPNIPLVNCFEFIIVFKKEGRPRVKKISQARKAKSKLSFEEFKWASESMWHIPAERNRKHPCPCPFPVDIPKRLIKLFSFHDDIVLDPFCGSGTTFLACKQLDRRFIGIEINPEYCKMARNRVYGLENSLNCESC